MDPIPETGQRRLTEENVRKLQPSLIRPMSPVSISSSKDDAAASMTDDEKIARLKSFVYHVMQTLLGLGSEGQQIVEADELYVAGLDDVRLRWPLAAQQPDLSDPAYWEAKLQYFENKCQPLSQERRKRRRLEQAAGERHSTRAGAARVPDDADDEAQAERAQIEESKVLWRAKQSSIEAWLDQLPAFQKPQPQRAQWRAAGNGAYERPPSSDSSIVEITSTQFSQAARGRQQAASTLAGPVPQVARAAAAAATAEASTASGPGPGWMVGLPPSVPRQEQTGSQPMAGVLFLKKEEELKLAEIHLRSPPESQGASNGMNGVNGVNGNGINGVNGVNGINGINGMDRTAGVLGKRQRSELGWSL